MADDAEVIVVGAGPAGSATAFFLARAGVDVLLLDRARFPRDKPCAEYLSPQASRLLDAMGVLAEVERLGASHLTGMRVRAPNGVEVHGQFAASHGFAGFRDTGLGIRRLALDALLVRAAEAAGARLREQVRVVDLEFAPGGGRAGITGVVVRDAAGGTRTMRAPLVVGADGLRSVVARRAHLGGHGRWPTRVALVTHYCGVDGVGDCGEMHVFAGGYVGLADVGLGVTNVALVVGAHESPGMAGDAAGFLARRLARAPGIAQRLSRATRVTTVRAVGTFNWRARRAWAPGVVLVGDAADFFDPFTGEGIYAALRGGEILASHAREAVRAQVPRRAQDALRAYEMARRREFGGKWKVERAVGVAVAFPLLINHAARSLAARADLADLLVGVTGDFVPAREVLRPGYMWHLITAGFTHPRPDRAGLDSSQAVPHSR